MDWLVTYRRMHSVRMFEPIAPVCQWNPDKAQSIQATRTCAYREPLSNLRGTTATIFER
jgi:hypothetical protein